MRLIRANFRLIDKKTFKESEYIVFRSRKYQSKADSESVVETTTINREEQGKNRHNETKKSKSTTVNTCFGDPNNKVRATTKIMGSFTRKDWNCAESNV